MKKTILALLVVFLIGILLGSWLFSEKGNSGSASSSADQEKQHASEPAIWTCSMHPQIQQDKLGDCPICGMDLIPLEKKQDADLDPRTLTMSESAKGLAAIQTTPVERRFPEAEISMVGKIKYNETKERSIAARFPARIDRLFVNYTGIPVKKGEHLAEVYSPELLVAQRELLASHSRNPRSRLTQITRKKLRLWNILPEQIEEIIKKGTSSDKLVLKAPIGGIVVSKNIKEGDYVQTGQALFKIVDLSELWLTLNAYESDLVWLRYGQDVEFTVEAYAGETFQGKIVFIDPELNSKTRTISIRVNVNNKDRRLKPGMFARGIVKSKVSENGQIYAPQLAGKWISPMHPEIIKDGPGTCDVCGMDLVPVEKLGYVENKDSTAPILVPTSAVLRTGKRAIVYVEKPNADIPTFEGREIIIGPRAGNFFIVVSGLNEGEKVVTKGAFKIDSSLQIQAKPSMMSPSDGTHVPERNHNQITIDATLATNLVGHYLHLQKALASDDLAAAKTSLQSMMKITGHSGESSRLIHTMIAAKSLDSIRRPHFETLSNAIIASIDSNPKSFTRKLLIMHCSMVYDDRGADWLQASEPLKNPYFGASMLHCGEVKKSIP